MAVALALLLVQGCLGALDTLVYHELIYRLPAHARTTRDELLLHAARDLVYGVLFLTLPFVHWQGVWAWVLGALLLTEVVITLVDFVVEDRVRAPHGGVAAGEGVMHAVMAILYGAFLANFFPVLIADANASTGFKALEVDPPISGWLFVGMGVGVWASGLRDYIAVRRALAVTRPVAVNTTNGAS